MSKVSVQVADICTSQQSMDEVACLEQMLNGGDFSGPPETGDHQPEGLRISFRTLSSQFEVVVEQAR